MSLCEIRNLTKYFGGLGAVKEFDLDIAESEILGLIGPNGSGKTTLFNVISGVYRPSSGSILFNDENIVGKSPHYICRKQIARTFQLTKILERLNSTLKTC